MVLGVDTRLATRDLGFPSAFHLQIAGRGVPWLISAAPLSFIFRLRAPGGGRRGECGARGLFKVLFPRHSRDEIYSGSRPGTVSPTKTLDKLL